MNFRKGDIVRIGKGKVEYTVLSDVTTSGADVESHNTGKAQTVDAGRLVLVKSAEDAILLVEQNDHDAEDLTFEDVLAPVGLLTGTVVSTVPERSAYSKAILAALQLKSHVFAGLKRPKARTTTRARKMAKNARRQARKATKR